MMFREKLNKLIKQKKIRGYQIAESIGISTAAVSRWRQGQSFPRCIELYRLSKVLGVTMEELIEEDTESRHPGCPLIDVKKGEWIEREVIYDNPKAIVEWQSAKCSACGRYHTTPYMYYFQRYNYCPNCGADMREDT